MQAFVQSLESFVLAMAVAAFAHFGVALKDAPCVKASSAAHPAAYVRLVQPRTIGRAAAPMAKDLRRA